MPKIEITDLKGLVQKTGSGVDVQSVGLEGVVVSSETSIPAAVGNTDIKLTLPAGALVTDFGFVVTSAVGGGAADGTMTVSLGTAEGGAELVAQAVVAAANTTIAAGRSMSVLNAVEAEEGSAAFGDFLDASPLHSTTSRNLFARFTQGAGAAAAEGKVFVYIKYIVVA